MSTRITKSKTDKVIDGVCGGLAEYFSVDSVLVRLVFVLLIFFNGLGLILYIVLVIIMPRAETADQEAKETIKENVQEIGDRIKEAGEGLGAAISRKTEEKRPHRRYWLGILLILLGLFFLLDSLHLIEWIRRDLIWPIILIFIGIWLLIRRWS